MQMDEIALVFVLQMIPFSCCKLSPLPRRTGSKNDGSIRNHEVLPIFLCPQKKKLDDFDSPIVGRLSYFAKSPAAAAFGTEKMVVEWVKTLWPGVYIKIAGIYGGLSP